MFHYSDALSESDDVVMTSEQSRVVAHPLRKGETLKVIAFAGKLTHKVYLCG